VKISSSPVLVQSHGTASLRAAQDAVRGAPGGCHFSHSNGERQARHQ
jgi:hypothetical protein